jgi:molybdopterin synthase catalytic subunit
MNSILAKLVSTPIAHDDVCRELEAPSCGAQVVFWGVVRDRNEGRAVRSVTYDAHGALAEKSLREIGEEACARWGDDLRVVILHRTGTLQVGEASLVIGVASPHRDEGYQASRYIIEQVKLRSPIWKQEHYVDGDSEWLGGHALPRRGSQA